MGTRTDAFDGAAERLTEERKASYGHPLQVFDDITIIKSVLQNCPHAEVRHALEMIAVKMVRLCRTPDHMDSVIDIAGYARTIAMVLDEEERRDGRR